MEQLSGLDAAFIHQESRRTPMHVTAVLLYDTGADGAYANSAESLLQLAADRLGQFPVFHRRLQRVPMGMDTPYWVDVAAPQWEHHIQEITLGTASGREDLQHHLTDLHSSPLDLKRPLWEMRLISELSDLSGLPRNCQALVLKMHHAAIDGVSMAAIIGALHAAPADAQQPVRRQTAGPSEWDLWSRANINYLGRQFKLADTIRKVVPGLVKARQSRKQFADLPPIRRTASHFNNRVSADRATGALLLPSHEVIAIKRAVRRVTTNDIAMSCIGGALRTYLAAHGRLGRESLACGAPISLRGPGDVQTGGNRIATMVVGLGTQLSDPVARLRMVHRYAVAGKKQIGALGTGTLMDISDSLTPGVLAEGIKTMARVSRLADMPVPFHTIISNVPGPQARMALGNAELEACLGLGPVRDNMGLFHIVSSSEKFFSLSFSACKKLLPDADFYQSCLDDAYTQLKDEALGVD